MFVDPLENFGSGFVVCPVVLADPSEEMAGVWHELPVAHVDIELGVADRVVGDEGSEHDPSPLVIGGQVDLFDPCGGRCVAVLLLGLDPTEGFEIHVLEPHDIDGQSSAGCDVAGCTDGPDCRKVVSEFELKVLEVLFCIDGEEWISDISAEEDRAGIPLHHGQGFVHGLRWDDTVIVEVEGGVLNTGHRF